MGGASNRPARGACCSTRHHSGGGAVSAGEPHAPGPRVVVAVDHSGAAAALGTSSTRLRHHVRLGDLTPHFSGTKPIYLVSELQRFVELLPTRAERLPPA